MASALVLVYSVDGYARDNVDQQRVSSLGTVLFSATAGILLGHVSHQDWTLGGHVDPSRARDDINDRLTM
jgi:hypothetical protein